MGLNSKDVEVQFKISTGSSPASAGDVLTCGDCRFALLCRPYYHVINLKITLYYEVDDIIKSCHPPHNHVINLNKNLLVKLFPIQAEVPSARDCQIYTAQGGW